MQRKSYLVQVYVKSAKDFYMPLWEPNEISKLWNASYRNSRHKDHVRELFSQWGGCVRWILEKPYEDSKNKLQEAVDSSTGENLLAACRSENDDKVNPLLCLLSASITRTQSDRSELFMIRT